VNKQPNPIAINLWSTSQTNCNRRMYLTGRLFWIYLNRSSLFQPERSIFIRIGVVYSRLRKVYFWVVYSSRRSLFFNRTGVVFSSRRSLFFNRTGVVYSSRRSLFFIRIGVVYSSRRSLFSYGLERFIPAGEVYFSLSQPLHVDCLSGRDQFMMEYSICP